MCGNQLGHEQYFLGGYEPRMLRAILSASDCAGVSSAFGGPLGENTALGNGEGDEDTGD
jgi:hypothetical protein